MKKTFVVRVHFIWWQEEEEEEVERHIRQVYSGSGIREQGVVRMRKIGIGPFRHNADQRRGGECCGTSAGQQRSEQSTARFRNTRNRRLLHRLVNVMLYSTSTQK